MSMSKRKLKIIGSPPSECSTPGSAPHIARNVLISLLVGTAIKSVGFAHAFSAETIHGLMRPVLKGAVEMAFSAKINIDGAIGITDEALLIHGCQPPDKAWRFQIGQCVSHISQDMPSLIIGRLRAGNGSEFYGARSYATKDDNRDRMVSGDSLVDVTPGAQPCNDCLLYNTGMCPGDLRR